MHGYYTCTYNEFSDTLDMYAVYIAVKNYM